MSEPLARAAKRASATFISCLALAACGGKANRTSVEQASAESSSNTSSGVGGQRTDSASVAGASAEESGGTRAAGSGGTSATEVVSVASGGVSDDGFASGGSSGGMNYPDWDEVCPDLSELLGGPQASCGTITTYYEGIPADDCQLDTSFDHGNAMPLVAVDCEPLEQVGVGQAGAPGIAGWIRREDADFIELTGEACEQVRDGVERVDVIFVCQY